jgi:hypothetical protein
MLAAISDNACKLGDKNMRKSPKTKTPSIKALTIRQPFPELILRRRKHVEIRSWRAHYTGPLLIHAGMRIDSESATEAGLNSEELTTSAFVGVAVLSEVRPYTRKDARILKKRRAGGHDWEPGSFAWVLEEPKPLRIPPIKAKGQLGLFGVSTSVGKRVAPYIRKLQTSTNRLVPKLRRE